MEIFDQIGWLLFIGLIFYYFLRSPLKSTHDTFESDEVRQQLQSSMNRIFSSWSFHTLKRNVEIEIKRFPKYEALLTHAFQQQYKFLQDFENGYRYAVERVKAIVHHQLEQCRNIEDYNLLKMAYAHMIEISPPIENLFENYRLWFYRNESTTESQRKKEPRKHHRTQKKKDLFSKCNSLDEVKQRFRRLAFLNHPDRGGKEAAMREVLRQYEEALSTFN